MTRLMRTGVLVAVFLGGMVGGMIYQQFSSLVASAAPGRSDLEVNSIRIVDADGKVRALFGLVNDKPQMKLFDANGRERFATVADDGGAAVTVYDHESKPRVTVGSERNNYMLMVYDKLSRIRTAFGVINEQPQLLLLGKDTKSKVVIKVSDNGIPHIGLFDKNDLVRSALTVDETTGASLSLADENGELRSTLFAGLNRGSALALSSESGNVGLMAYGKKDVFGLGVFNGNGTDGCAIQTDANGSVLGFRDSQQKMRAVAGIRNDKPWIGVLDPAGAPVWGGPGSAPNLPPMGDLDAATRDLLR